MTYSGLMAFEKSLFREPRSGAVEFSADSNSSSPPRLKLLKDIFGVSRRELDSD